MFDLPPITDQDLAYAHAYGAAGGFGICNGCGVGPRAVLWYKILGKTSRACDVHDLRYYLGGPRAWRRAADHELYVHVRTLGDALPWLARLRYRLAAWLFYRAVRWTGGRFWNAAQPYDLARWRAWMVDHPEQLRGTPA